MLIRLRILVSLGSDASGLSSCSFLESGMVTRSGAINSPIFCFFLPLAGVGSFLVPVGLITVAGFTFSSGSGGFGGITTTSVINGRADLIRVSKICFCAASCSKIGCNCSDIVDVSNGNNCDKLTSCGSG